MHDEHKESSVTEGVSARSALHYTNLKLPGTERERITNKRPPHRDEMMQYDTPID